MKVKRSWFKRFKGWLLSVILIDLITLFTRLVESLFPKDNNLLTIFFTENNFADNGRYFLEYLSSNTDHNYEVKVLVKNKSLFDEIGLQYPDVTYYSKSLSGLKLFLKTKNLVISHGSDASYFFPYFLDVKSKNIINLWHGIPLKRLSLQVKGIRESKSRNRFQKFSSICAASTFEQFLLASCFDIHVDDVWVTGTPRNDYLLHSNNDLVQEHAHLNKKVILYAPTWREYGERSSFFPFNDKDLEGLNAFLETQDAYLLMRGHREEMERITDNYGEQRLSRILPAHQEIFPDVQRLLVHVDVLVTDYSSIYLDFLLLDKPMVFIPYDLEEYQSYRGFLFDYESHTPGDKVGTQSEFMESLDRALNQPEFGASERVRMKNLFHTHQDGKSSERIIAQINKMNC
ncbi:MAG: CDP-glycerol glycerophosphotransferase family protein [Flavobacteriales bacterium]|nr:CDP-glycerol glycerophosphotransferase family protein [Flavobacteriales bacterium]